MCQEPGEGTEHLLPRAPNACATGNLQSGKITDPSTSFPHLHRVEREGISFV